MNTKIQCFLDVVSVGKVGSPLTVNWYTKCLNRYVQWAESHSDDPFSRPSFNAFITHLKQKGRSVTTVRGYVVILKRFGRWLLAEEYVDRDPSVDLKYPPKPKRSPRGISQADFESFWQPQEICVTGFSCWFCGRAGRVRMRLWRCTGVT